MFIAEKMRELLKKERFLRSVYLRLKDQYIDEVQLLKLLYSTYVVGDSVLERAYQG